MLFHEEFFISSTMEHEQTRLLYNYIIGTGDCERDYRKFKILTYKDIGQPYRLKGYPMQQQEAAAAQESQTDFA